jgi:hypothetical protein
MAQSRVESWNCCMDQYPDAQSRGFEIREKKNNGCGSHHRKNSPSSLSSSYPYIYTSMCVVASNSLSSHRVFRVPRHRKKRRTRWPFAAFHLTSLFVILSSAGAPQRSMSNRPVPSFPYVVACCGPRSRLLRRFPQEDICPPQPA